MAVLRKGDDIRVVHSPYVINSLKKQGFTVNGKPDREEIPVVGAPDLPVPVKVKRKGGE